MGVSRVVKPIVNKGDVVGIVECQSRNKKKKSRFIKFLIKIYNYFLSRETLKSFCSENNIPYYLMDRVSNKYLEEWVKEKNPDVIVVYSMSQLLKENIFSIPKYGTINLHPAKLPNYRGPNPWFWSYYNKDKKGGVTLHYIDKGEDTGDIIYQTEYEIPLGMKSPEMQDLAIGKIGNELINKALENIDNLPRVKQLKESPTKRARNIKAVEHANIIKWGEWDVEHVWHVLRGTELWLNAIEQPKGIFSGQRWTVGGMEKLQDVHKYSLGEIYSEKGKTFVVCKDGIIFISVNFRLLKFLQFCLKRIF